jgi:ABC-type multidrug transport system ATPase subunit
MENENNAFTVESVRLESQGFKILNGVSCAFESGRVSVIMGATGSGKTALLKVCAGLLIPDGGRVLFRGKDLATMGKRELASFRAAGGFAFQDSALWENMSIGDNLILPQLVSGKAATRAEAEARARDCANRLGYAEKLSARPATLSFGEKKLIGIARALAADPEILYLDEPNAFLDEPSRVRVREVTRERRSAGKTVITVSHSLRYARDCADKVYIMHAGKLRAQGGLDELLASTDRVTRAVLRSSEQAPDRAGGLL